MALIYLEVGIDKMADSKSVQNPRITATGDIFKGIGIKLTQPKELSFSSLETFLAKGPAGEYENLEEESLVLWIFYLHDNRIEPVIQLTLECFLNGLSRIKALSYIHSKILIVSLMYLAGGWVLGF